MQQMSKKEHIQQFMQTLDNTALDQVEDITAQLFRAKNGQPGWDVTFYDKERKQGKAVATAFWEKLHLDTMDAPVPEVGKDDFTLSAEATVEVSEAQDIFLQLAGDDGYRMYIDDKLVMGDWNDHELTTDTHMQHFAPGHTYRCRVEFYDHVNGAILKFSAVKLKQ